MTSILAASTLLFCSLSLGSRAETSAHDPFLMRVGTTWVYAGVVRWYDMQTQRTVSARVTSKCEVARVLRRDFYVAALMHGFPWDFDWSDGEAVASDWLVVWTRDGRIEIPGDEHLQENLKRLEDPGDSLQGVFDVDDLWMRLPLRKGMKFCDDESKKRVDDRYCWVVATAHRVFLNNVKGLQPGNYTSFLLQYVTLPDDTELEFVPNLGFISYRYHHHGSVADTEMKLVEYRPAGDNQPNPGDNR